jgi:hypothetical protein
MRFSLLLLPQTVHDVLLADLKDIVSQPVEDKAAGEAYKQEGKNNGHQKHHPCLGRVSRCGRHFLADVLGDSHQNGCHVEGVFGGQILDPQDEGAVPELDSHH